MSYVTKDSGERSEYESGMRRDTQDGKPNFALCMTEQPFDDQMLTRWAALMERGAKKYGKRNWQLANSEAEYERFKESAFRHFMQWLCGVDDGEDHAAATFFNINAAEFVKWRLGQTTQELEVEPVKELSQSEIARRVHADFVSAALY